MSNRYFYFTRHGQTIWNVENKICGATDIALTDLGHQQAIDLGSKIAQEDLGIDEILYSPLMRAADTAKHISQMTGIPARMEPRLKEQNFGNFVCRYEGGESMLQLCQRIYNLLDDIKNDPSGKTYLLVAHNGISRAIESYFRDMTNEEFASFGIKNCELRKYEFNR